MPQLSLYIDAETLAKIEKAAKLNNTSISKWVSGILSESLVKKWPDNYDNLFGSIQDDTFTEDTIKDFSGDTEREEL
ncbi:hypothetical protein [Dethiobacter alkaliphilus]|uniref:hypothetical protein n=1 Tax=Dethiobacter alkaliphilus TaxID=427926 RepID=UPI0022265621|nr:hypothetical protein [Dethiobacter alkaliphilus]MCW3489790.1 hypothetical protein [Dethiobacter alkaliphilus]